MRIAMDLIVPDHIINYQRHPLVYSIKRYHTQLREWSLHGSSIHAITASLKTDNQILCQVWNP